jgi:nuclear pore complex protein Nup160
MEYSAATSIQVTSFGLDDCLFAVTVCLDHRMRIWNLDDGQIILTRDILNADRSPQEIGKWSIDPSQSNLLQITGNNRGHRICSTYSPVGPGEFKFWKIAAKDAHTVVIDDMFPKEALHPVTPSSDVWTLTDFVLASPDENSINLWTLWKNNLTYRVQRLELERPSITHNWRHGWDAVFSETGLVTAENSGPCDPTDVTEKWLAMILQPGKFTKATLQTALSIYERGLGAAKDGNQNRGLAESICSVLGSTASLDRGSTGAMDYEQFRSSSEAQWRRFYRLLVELDRQRGEAIGLAMSPNDDMVWVVCTDMISAIRECSSLERLYHSLDAPADDQGHMAAIVGSALTLVDGFSDHFVQLSNAALRPELFEESEKSDLQRLEAFENKAGFWRGITEEDCAQVNEALGTNFDKVDDNLYTDVLDLIAAPSSSKNQSPRYPLTDFGRKLVLQGAQDNIDLRWKVCFAQLILLAHMEFDFDTDEDQLHNRVDVGTVFKQLVDALRRLELLKWLSSTEVAMPQSIAERRGSVVSKKGSEEPQVVTALDLNVSHLLGFSDSRSENLSANITDLVSNLCAPDSDIEILPPLVQCRLVKDDRADLALGLAPFADQSAFSTYVQGRVFLALKDFSSAALCFRDASEGMSKYPTQRLGNFH